MLSLLFNEFLNIPILNEFLIAGKESLVEPLCRLFNLVFNSGTYPSLWSLNFLRPVHKKDDRKDPDNYRGIAVGSCLSKLYSYVLLNRLQKHAEKYGLIKNNQIGFMKENQASDHMFVLKTLIDKTVKCNQNRIYTAFVDFKKAYDTINRKKLFSKLKQAEVGDTFLNNLKAMYKSVKYCVKVANGYTDPISSDRGLKQGCVLSPILFNLFIDDIKNIFDQNCAPLSLMDVELNYLLYADDLILMSSSPEGLQNSLNALGTYCQAWDLTVNIKKSKVMIFNPAGKMLTDHKFSYLSQNLEMVQDFTYLGVTFSASGSFTKAAQNLRDKANKAMFPLLDTTFKFCLGIPTSLSLFDKLIEPIVLYGSEIWGSLSHHQLNSISRDPNLFCRYMIDSQTGKSKLKFSKSILGLKRNTPSLAVYGELGTIPNSLTGTLRVIKFWHRISQKGDHTLVKKALDESKSLPNNLSNWLNTVKTVLNLFGLSSIWNNPSSFSPNQVNTRLKEKSLFLFKEFWLSELSIAKEGSTRNSKLRTYKTFKSNLKLEPYLTHLCFGKRQALCKFRCSDHTLLIEIGRHKGLAVEERKCEMCTLRLVEDEIHFLITCPAYDNLRTTLLALSNVDCLPASLQFSKIMSSTDPIIMHALAKFIFDANSFKRASSTDK